MKVGLRSVKRFQEGGPMPGAEPSAEEGQPMPPEQGGAPGNAPGQGGGDPLMEIAQMAMQALQTQDCKAAMQVCETFVQLVQQSGGGAGQPGGAPPQEGQPVYRRGGRLVRKIY